MKKLIAVLLALLLGFIFFTIPLPQSMAAPVVAYDFLANALNASWNGWTAGTAAPITFNQTSFTMSDGMAALYGKAPNPTGVSLEDGLKYSPSLWMVAPGGPGITGSTGVTGDYYHVYIPSNASLHITFGLTKGDTGETGIIAGVAFADDDPSYPLVELIKETKDYDGTLRDVTVDLSSEGGRTGGFQLFVRSPHPDDADGVVWVQAAIEVTTPPPPTSPLVLHFYIGNSSYLVDTTPKQMDTAPVILESRTFLPIRYVAQELGATVDWVQSEQKVTLTFSGKKIELWIGQNSASVNGSFVLIDPSNPAVIPFIQPPGRTMMPLRFISENMGCKVEWFQAAQEARVTYPAP
ncbi:MAG: copper amine oxidase N-terminal domain-containing protein [bacterium]